MTIEIEDECSIVTSMDVTGEHPDTQLLIFYDNKVYIRQFNEKTDRYNVVSMTYEQLKGLTMSLNLPEGSYMVEGPHDQ